MSKAMMLNQILTDRKKQFSDLSDDDFFEVYCADNILINYDLSSEEILDGIVDGNKDGGIDSVFVFVNRVLVSEDFNFQAIRAPVDIELFVIQSKNQSSFKENPVDKISASLPIFLDPNQSIDTLYNTYNTLVVSKFSIFRHCIEYLAHEFPNVKLNIFYCCKGFTVPEAAKLKAKSLQNTLDAQNYDSRFSFLGTNELYERSRIQKRLTKDLKVFGTPISDEDAYVALCPISDYIDFITDDECGLITRIFEANVRAYQGAVDVNKEISNSVKDPDQGVDFWWLNNGVTIVCDDAQFRNGKLNIENPLIVNGLQTSHVLQLNKDKINKDDNRKVLVRILIEKDREKRDKIIRATNRQTNIKPSSFRATEPIHIDIERYLKSVGYFYDRRKNFYKSEGKPASKIISIDRLAQGVLAVLHQQPHTARARPTTALKDDDLYEKIFPSGDNTHNFKIYGNIVQLMSIVNNKFKEIANSENQVHRNNLRFHALMVISWQLNAGQKIPAERLAQLNPADLSDDAVGKCIEWVFEVFQQAGGVDRVAKDAELTNTLKHKWQVL